MWTTEESINFALTFFLSLRELGVKLLADRVKVLSGGFVPSEMKIVYYSLWHKARNESSELNIESLKTRKRLDEAMKIFCVTLIERNQTKNVGIPNDVVVVT